MRSDRNLEADAGVVSVILHPTVSIFPIEDGVEGLGMNGRQGKRLPVELFFETGHMIHIDMCIALPV